MHDIRKLAELCLFRKHVYIQTHDFPDPDAIASAFGLQKLLELYKIRSTICYDGLVDRLSSSKMLDMLGISMKSVSELGSDMTDDDFIICVDSQKNSGAMRDLIGDEVACIDHHPTNVPVEYQYTDIRQVGACATLIAQYWAESEFDPDKDVATALLYGIKMDTLQFTRGVTELDVDMFKYLLPKYDKSAMASLEINNMEFKDLDAYATAIADIEIYGKLGFSYIPFSCPNGLIAVISEFILALNEVDTAIVFSRRSDGIKFSVRSYDQNIHAGDLIHKALEGVGEGGGHFTMAGGLIPSENIQLLEGRIKNAVRQRVLDAANSL